MVALSVSISAMTSPEETVSPSLTCHLASLPSSIVGERAGMVISMLISASLADVFVPEFWIVLDEFRHHVLAARLLVVDHVHPGERHHVLEPLEVPAFGDDHARNAELDDRSSAHHAWAQRRVAGDVAISPLPAGVLDRIHLAVEDRIALLHPL